ncbi:MAG: TVP38/TMEM64 family protein [Ruminococcaceae bacterium]|nr:TVP38/TMEM64 family protein [Oscillospiraceae bacterium]
MKKKSFKLITTIIYIITLVLLTIIVFPLVKSYKDPEAFLKMIDSLGAFGFFAMLFIQTVQVMVALIPGEIVEFIAGTLYGWFGGMIICLIGIALGQTIIFFSVKYFGESLVEKAAGSKAMVKYKFLRDEKRLKTVVFILYFIPGTPKDLLTYFVPLTKIKFLDFLVLSLLARIPSVVTSTYGGDAFADKDYISLAITYSIILLISIGGMIIYRIWDSKHKKDG